MTLLALAPLVALAALGRALLGSWLAPGVFFALYWSLAFVVPLVIAPQDPVSAAAVLWVFLAAGAVFVGALFGGGLDFGPVREQPGEAAITPDARRPLALAAIGCAVLGLGAPLIPLVSQGYGFTVFTSLKALVSAAIELSVGRYSETYSPPALSQAALPLLSAGPVFAGALAALRPRRVEKLAVVGVFLPPLLLTVTQTQRAVTILAVVNWISAYLAVGVLLGRTSPFTRRHLVVAALGGLFAIVLAFVGAMVRVGASDLNAIADVAPKVLGGALGHATVFSQWFESGGAAAAPPTWGAYTFAGLYDALGIGQRRPGLFAESVVLASGDETNIYTMFRPLIQDFTLVGALVALTVLGLIGGVAYRAVGRGRIELVPVLAGFYATTLFSAITSIWVYNSMMAVFVLFAVATLAYGRYRRRVRGTAAVSYQPATEQ